MLHEALILHEPCGPSWRRVRRRDRSIAVRHWIGRIRNVGIKDILLRGCFERELASRVQIKLLLGDAFLGWPLVVALPDVGASLESQRFGLRERFVVQPMREPWSQDIRPIITRDVTSPVDFT